MKFNLADRIDIISEKLEDYKFSGIKRIFVFRSVLAAAGKDIYQAKLEKLGKITFHFQFFHCRLELIMNRWLKKTWTSEPFYYIGGFIKVDSDVRDFKIMKFFSESDETGMFDAGYRTSNIKHQTSNIKHQTSNIKQ